jgi:hypothetical protein
MSMRRIVDALRTAGLGLVELSDPQNLNMALMNGAQQGTPVRLTPGTQRQIANARGPFADSSMLVSLTRDDGSFSTSSGLENGVDADVFARINYGAGGNAEQVDVDFVSGTVLHVPGNFAQIIGVYPALAAQASEVELGDYAVTVGAIVTAGRKSSEGPTGTARRTVRTGLVAHTGVESARFAIPNRAISMRVGVADSPLDALPLTIVRLYTVPATFTARTGTHVLTTGAGAPSWTPHDIEIPNGARSFTLAQTAATDLRYSVVFTLAL